MQSFVIGHKALTQLGSLFLSALVDHISNMNNTMYFSDSYSWQASFDTNDFYFQPGLKSLDQNKTEAEHLRFESYQSVCFAHKVSAILGFVVVDFGQM